MQEFIRFGIVGCGGIARLHASNLAKIPETSLVGVHDVIGDAMKTFASTFSCESYESASELISKDRIDALIIATPHDSHGQLAMLAIDAGVHALIEKPMTLTAGEAQRVLERAATKPQIRLGVGYMQRTMPVWQRVRQLVQDGVLGRITRLAWTATDWYRTQAYYNSGGWRGTWKGEGGGLLVNQLPHNLDLLVWIAGKASAVTAHLGFGKHHQIEVEDELHAIIEFEQGHVGTLVSSTGEAAGVNRVEIVGTEGALRVEGQKIEVTRYDVPADRHIKTTTKLFESPGHTTRLEQPERAHDDHLKLLRNFADAIRGQAPLIAPATEGLAPVELANALHLSGWTKQRVELPLDHDHFERLLQQRRTP